MTKMMLDLPHDDNNDDDGDTNDKINDEDYYRFTTPTNYHQSTNPITKK